MPEGQRPAAIAGKLIGLLLRQLEQETYQIHFAPDAGLRYSLPLFGRIAVQYHWFEKGHSPGRQAVGLASINPLLLAAFSAVANGQGRAQQDRMPKAGSR